MASPDAAEGAGVVPLDAADGIGARLQVLHLVDLYAADLLGLLPSGTEGPGVFRGASPRRFFKGWLGGFQ